MSSISNTSRNSTERRRRVDGPLPSKLRRSRPLPRSRPHSSTPRRRFGHRRLGIALSLVIVSLVGAWGAGRLWQGYSAASIAARLDQEPTAELDRLLAKTRVLGDVGRSTLVEALVHERDEVRSAARRQLTAEFDSWRTLDPTTASKRVAALADELVQIMPRTPATGRRFVASLATELLTWPIDAQAIDAPRLVHDCEILLRAGFDSEPLQSVERRGPTTDSSGLSIVDPSALITISDRTIASVVAPSPPPLPIDLGGSSADSNAVLPESDRAAMPETTDPPGFSVDRPEPSRFVPSGPGAPLELDAARSTPDAPRSPTIVDPQVGAAPLDPPWTARQLTASSHLELLKRLHVSNALERDAARHELSRRGFRDEMIELGKRMTDSDPQVRRVAVESLRKRPRFDPIPWLVVAAKDGDPDVRRVALDALASGDDPFQARWARRRLEELGDNGAEIR